MKNYRIMLLSILLAICVLVSVGCDGVTDVTTTKSTTTTTSTTTAMYDDPAFSEYSSLIADGWSVPTAEQLDATSWTLTNLTPDGDVHWFELYFNAQTVDVRWDNDGETHEYEGAEWSFVTKKGITFIEFDFAQFEGIQTCAILISKDEKTIYTCHDFVDDALSGDSVTSFGMLERMSD